MLKSQQVLQERYCLQERLGQTGSGRQTWLATDLQSSENESVILKLLAFNPQMQWEDIKLFERESQVLKNLDHPRIPKYRDYFAIDGEAGEGLPWFVLVQEYIPGLSLKNLLDQGKQFSEAQVDLPGSGYPGNPDLPARTQPACDSSGYQTQQSDFRFRQTVLSGRFWSRARTGKSGGG
ncbi:hypothetical protein K9N68_02500 [Kovacikia minuta CCNUW1]|uniref:hypothetical protein n=1 Tax=Kovacikia minuta TaxID=2931930 RepID=UPI001CCFF783|nr:hypothetical protein K9N68_02500 [Kovacikia minuta CCNUW1]